MKIVVAGGTGFLGRHITQSLIDAGHDVTVLGRSPARVGDVPECAGANATRGDVTNPESLTGTLDGAEAVVNCVQFPNHPIEVPRRGLTYDRYDRAGTQSLIAEAERAGVAKFFYLSGAGADSSSEKTWYRAKGRAEESIRATSMSHVILRPSWAYGPGDRALNRFAAIARFSPVLPRLGVRAQHIQPVYVDDVAKAVCRAFEREEAWDRTFEIGGPVVMTMDEVMRTLLEVMGKRRLIVPIPLALAKLGTAPLTMLPAPPMTPQGVEFAAQSGVVDTAPLREVLEVQPVGLREGLSRYMRAA